MQPIEGAGSFYPKAVEPVKVEAQFHHPEEATVAETQSAVIGIVQGATGTFVADLIDENGNVITDPTIIASATLTWSSSDTINEPVVASGTAGDLGASITVPVAAPVNAVGATLTVTTNLGITDSVAVPVLAGTPPPPPPTTIAAVVLRQTA
jgi:hypothetical protein